MPPRRKQQSDEPQRPPRRTKSVEETRSALQKQIDKGTEIAKKINPGAYMPNDFDSLESEANSWSSYNHTLLRHLFDTEEVAKNYGYIGMFGTAMVDNPYKKLKFFLDETNDRINFLETEIDKLDIYEEAQAARSEPPEIRTYGAATRQPWTRHSPETQPIVHISHSTFGVLNLGQVKGSINAHVATVSGSSANEFREAIEMMADVVAGATELAEERRRDVLEYIDTLAEQAGYEPAERKLPIIKGMLLAIPAALEVSAHALDAWDKYGPAIRLHFGL